VVVDSAAQSFLLFPTLPEQSGAAAVQAASRVSAAVAAKARRLAVRIIEYLGRMFGADRLADRPLSRKTRPWRPGFRPIPYELGPPI
jgi:hypothetical protein